MVGVGRFSTDLRALERGGYRRALGRRGYRLFRHRSVFAAKQVFRLARRQWYRAVVGSERFLERFSRTLRLLVL